MFLKVSVYDLDLLDIRDLIERFDGFIRWTHVIIPETEEAIEYLQERNVKFRKIEYGG